MFNNTILDIAIGLVLMYLVLSLMGTVINEAVSTALDVRAKTLQGAITSLLDDKTLQAAFYDHGLVAGTAKATDGRPSYLSGQTFASAIIGSLSDKPLPTIDDIKATLGKMQDTNIRDALLAQVTKSGNDIDKLRNEIANYFDTSMDRVTGVYKRYMKQITLIVGFIIVVVLNADSINVGTAMWNDSSLRAQMIETSRTVLAGGPPAAGQKPVSVSDVTTQLTKLESDLRPLPVGWSLGQLDYARAKWNDGAWTVIWWLIVKLIGLTITAFAISLGAPFWFDMLSKFMNVRGAGAKPDTTSITEVKQPPAATLTIVSQQPGINAGGAAAKP
jgi:hypothetical protein